jgi:hypothetical protein
MKKEREKYERLFHVNEKNVPMINLNHIPEENLEKIKDIEFNEE